MDIDEKAEKSPVGEEQVMSGINDAETATTEENQETENNYRTKDKSPGNGANTIEVSEIKEAGTSVTMELEELTEMEPGSCAIDIAGDQVDNNKSDPEVIKTDLGNADKIQKEFTLSESAEEEEESVVGDSKEELIDNDSKKEELVASDSKEEKLVAGDSKEEESVASDSKEEKSVASDSKEEESIASDSKEEKSFASDSNKEKSVASDSKEKELDASGSKEEESVDSDSKEKELVASDSKEEESVVSDSKEGEKDKAIELMEVIESESETANESSIQITSYKDASEHGKEHKEKELNNQSVEEMDVSESQSETKTDGTDITDENGEIVNIDETVQVANTETTSQVEKCVKDSSDATDNSEKSAEESMEVVEISEQDSVDNKKESAAEESMEVVEISEQDSVDNKKESAAKESDKVVNDVEESNKNVPVVEADIDNGETILPDPDKIAETEDVSKEIISSDSNEQYIVTNYTDKDSFDCMQCNKSFVPKYACNFEGKTSHICSDACLDVLKEKKPDKVTVRGLRVKMFAAEDPSLRTTTTPDADEKDILNHCKHCSGSLDSNNYFTWNTYNYCNVSCMGASQKVPAIRCVECNMEVPENLIGKYSVRFGYDMKQFCKNSCLMEHKKGQKFCLLCQAHIRKDYSGFCSIKCYEVHNTVNTKRVGTCAVCLKQKMLEIEYVDDKKMFCGEPCFVAYKFVNKLEPSQCEFCKIYKQRMPCSFTFGGSSHYLCSKDCQKLFIITNRRIVHCLWCNVKKYNFDMIEIARNNVQLVVCSLNCYKLYEVSLTAVQSGQSGCHFCHKNNKPLFHLTTLDAKVHNFCSTYCLNAFKEKLTEDLTRSDILDDSTEAVSANQFNGTEPVPPQTKRPVKKIVMVKPQQIPQQRNISIMCKPYQITKSINCRPKETQKGCQTEEFTNKFFLPVPVPIYVPAPAHMYTQPVPMPVPFPMPIPVPIFIPTTRKSANGILKEINKIKHKVPADPLEAELLMMAEMVAGDKKDDTDSDSDEDTTAAKEFSQEPLSETNNSFGEDVLQMALKMASDFEEPVDLEGAVSATTISAQTGNEDSAQRIENIMETKRRNIRQARQTRRSKQQSQTENLQPPPPSSAQSAELDKPDANMCLKYTFGVNAWKQWVTTKNLELQKTSKRVKLFKTEILQLTADELNFSLCLFVKEVRKPNGTEYAPDTIYYLCLGIQQYLYENGRIDNIFCDTFYEKFTDCLNEVCRKFSLLYNESQYIVTRVEEEHLWESKQLGAHSPLVLLNTLMFFNTKHFSLTTVDEHLQLSFSHIMKHWKRNPHQAGARNVLLRFYPPQNAEGPRKKKVYEQHENEDNPLRCPVKLYEFYLSKCPESVKTRNDVFYLQPERSCVPDSPVWYSTMALGQEPLEKMLNRVKMVKEINIALLTT